MTIIMNLIYIAPLLEKTHSKNMLTPRLGDQK